MKSTIHEIFEKSVDGIRSRMEMTKERIKEFEDRAIEIINLEGRGKKIEREGIAYQIQEV